MKFILSPTKTMAGADVPPAQSRPAFEAEAGALIRELAPLSVAEVGILYKTSEALTRKTRDQIHGFETAPETAALTAFRGEAFKTLAPENFSPRDLAFANAHLRIFSGLYGILAPLDAIRPYRLDFTTPLKVEGKGLAAFWKERINSYFREWMAPGEALVNLASDEYSRILTPKGAPWVCIDLQFREKGDGKLKNLSVRAKQARGSFARYLIENRISSAGALKTAVVDGYAYEPTLSSEGEWFFVR